ncbi:hypothetical protein [Methylobacterium soli]|uniref:Uncharacterized protein n=1 Tax=Methylobacterium soli TaxID=553447 RepID=A0A6L3SYY3_9HYPH|nr:hypothetical protein [Methylobacterium soli]KAB1075403.1 hypothetical protein F6X53_24860 [Methylobacterium soli]
MRLFFISATVICLGGPALAQSHGDALVDPDRETARLNELRATSPPKQAQDLDTLQLASAHRERAASVQEKTNGLWQSWLVSICEGCGDTPPHHKTIQNDYVKNKGYAGLPSEPRTVSQRQAPPQREVPERYGRRLYSDLSPEIVGQIRRMPGR